MKIKREVKIAIVAIVGLALFIWGLNFLKGKDLLGHHKFYYAVYDQVNGLVEANPILMNGVKIGQVDRVFFHPDGSSRVVAKMRIQKDIPIPKRSIARIYSSDLMGSKAIDILVSNAPTVAQSGDTLLSEMQATLQEEVSIQMLPLKKKTENLLSSFDSVLAVIQYVFNENTRDNLRKTFESIKFTIQNLEKTTHNIDTLVESQRGDLSGIITNIRTITSTFRNNSEELDNAIKNFSDISDTLAKANLAVTIERTNKTLGEVSSIVEKINTGQGSLGLLVNNDSLYKELNGAASELNMLIEDMKLNPQRYVSFSIFGKRKPYKPPVRQ